LAAILMTTTMEKSSNGLKIMAIQWQIGWDMEWQIG